MPMQIIKLPVHIIFYTWHSLYWKFHFISCLHWQNPRPTPPTAWRSGSTQVFPWWCHLILKNLSHHRCHEEWGFRLCFPLEISGAISEKQFLSRCNLQINVRATRFNSREGLGTKYFHWQLRKLCFGYSTCPKPPANHVDVNLREDTLKPPSSPKRKKTQKILSLTFQQSALSLQPGWFSYFLR